MGPAAGHRRDEPRKKESGPFRARNFNRPLRGDREIAMSVKGLLKSARRACAAVNRTFESPVGGRLKRVLRRSRRLDNTQNVPRRRCLSGHSLKTSWSGDATGMTAGRRGSFF